jgi:phage repressor protein C with HTH and peptisase S24 domain
MHRLFPDEFALQTDGESMEPKINHGDIVILSPSVPAPKGHPAVVQLHDKIGLTCKIIRTAQKQLRLIPINEKNNAIR